MEERQYKIKDGFVLRKVANQYIVVAIGLASKEFNGMIHLNETSAFLWEKLKEVPKASYLKEELLKEYDVKEDVAIDDINRFLKELLDNGIIEQ